MIGDARRIGATVDLAIEEVFIFETGSWQRVPGYGVVIVLEAEVFREL